MLENPKIFHRSILTSNWIRDLTDLGTFSSYMQCMYYHKKTCTLNMLWLFFVFPEPVRIVINLLLTILHSLCISIISASKYFCFLYNDHIKQNENTTQLSQALHRCYVDIGVTTILGQTTIHYLVASGSQCQFHHGCFFVLVIKSLQ